jgi:hypothetical protein
MLWKNHEHMREQLRIQMSTIQTLTNLATSKDLSTFSTLQTLAYSQGPQSNASPLMKYDPEFLPKDDASIANFLAQQYAAQGLDPNAAYDKPEDAIRDFGTDFL